MACQVMRAKVAFVLGLGSFVLSGCGSPATRDAILEATAAAAIEVGAAALRAAADNASARDAAKAARAHTAPTGNWRLVRQDDEETDCNDASADDEDCIDSATNKDETTEATENAPSLGKCMVCE